MNKRYKVTKKTLYNLPSDVVYIGRPSKYGNPYKIGRDGTREEVVDKYRRYLNWMLRLNPKFLEPLIGKRLGCWCNLDLLCHGDVIIEVMERLYG